MAKARHATTIDPTEAEHFGALAAEWWDPKGSSAMLHKLNPVRLRYLRDRINAHWGLDPRVLKPLAGKSAIDVGCGAGLMSEPLARLGAAVTGIDAAAENIAVARQHAAGQCMSINYVERDIADFSGQFDLVCSMEVIEHVTSPGAFLSALGSRLAPGGLMILSTPNRTGLSRLAMITLGEGLGAIPRGTHDWNKFLTPDELEAFAQAAGLKVLDRQGISFSVSAGFQLSGDMSLNYLMTLARD
ncbi:bifunctional 2-polyprenyl-6-hydroxyphenol methylase/3-demethylubiquinol 3-O-methyltransferase UbiG [Aquisediminimonas profunda]|uniref:bifunctional 2-polyprenyl-6-hydroxyphenol methylase/3-demethylubiquinol 3-O-methyltransferase UbiG n=1 Tax=Aquisediminimonas profunda TaxID=1550733 RepID=UPI001C6277D7|nr:bifunctional 2-polyprenyl-6-hydroxyphenol methylase/3-demethylubiquinol 3-O-methyltransferase UbiG [Aquisediminimonas profunda]